MVTLEDVLIEAGEIDRFYGDTVPVNLWRARNLNKTQVGLFDLVEEDQVRNGRVRPADVTIETASSKSSISREVPAPSISPTCLNEGSGSTIKFLKI